MRAPDAEADDRHRAGTDPSHSGASAFDSLRDGNAGQPPQRRSALPLAAAAFVGAVAASVLVGWWTGSAALVSLFPDLEPMPFDAALALLAGALGLACVDRERHAPARVLAAFLIALGAITLVEHAAGLVAVQRLLLGPMAPAGASSRRMEPNAALAFVFFGAALVVARSARRDRIYNVGFGVLAGGVEVLGVFALLGHAFGLDAAYGWGRLMSMAPQTAVSISVLGLGPTAMAWRKAAADRAQYGPGIAITALAGLVGSILLAGMLLGDDVRFRRALVRSELARFETVARRIAADRTLELERIARRSGRAPRTPASAWLADAENLLSESDLFESIRWVDADGSIRWVAPASAAADAPNEDLLRVPVPLGEDGVLIGTLGAHRLFDVAFDQADIGAHVLVSGERGAIYSSAPDVPPPTGSAASALRIGDTAWTIRGWPSDAQLVRTTPPILALVGGILLTLIATYALSQRRTALERAAAIEGVSHQLARSNEELGHFAYIASHDLQEPLRIVTSFCGRLDEKYGHSLDANARTYIGFIVEAAERMGELIEGLLRYSRIEGQSQQLEPVDCNDALADALGALRTLVAETEAEIGCDPLPIVSGNRILLGQLFQNLISNALKYRGERRPQVHVGVTEREDHWEFSVEDNGIGIDPRYQHKIFEIFERLTSRAEVSGTGIGLALCRKVVERLGGKIWVVSSPGQGSTFFFSLPKHRAAPVAALAE